MSRPLLPWCLFALATVLGLAAVVALTVETRDLSARLGRAEAALRDRPMPAPAPIPAATQAPAPAPPEPEETALLRAELQRVQQELAEALARTEGVASLVSERAAAEIAARQQRDAAARAVTAPMPEGVRLCLLQFHECLRADGFHDLRFLAARGLADRELQGVELLDADRHSLLSTFYLAGRMTAELDRGKGLLRLCFFDGHRTVNGARHAFPDDGFALELEPVTGRLWEERLPFLVRGQGAYLPDTPPDPVAGHRVDPPTRVQWLERLNGLLQRAGGTARLQVKDFEGMHDGRFLTVSLAGYDQRGLLQSQAMVADLAVEIDERARVVQLLLRDGSLRGPGGESSISADGHRMLLPDVTPEQGRNAMLGMVVTR